MTGYAVVSSVRLLRIDSRPTPRLTESPSVTLFIGPINSLPRRLSIVFRMRTINFKGDYFSRLIISYGLWGVRLHERRSFHTFRLIRTDQSESAIWKGAPHYMGARLFRDTGMQASTILTSYMYIG